MKNPLKIFALIILFIPAIKAQDTLDYGLSDPRNPKCPCHKYQKIADDEFKKLLASANNSPGIKSQNLNPRDPNNFVSDKNNGPSDFVNSNFSGSDNINKKKFHASTKHKHKKRIKLSPALRRFFDIGHWKIWKGLKKLDSCYHWR